MIAYKFSGVVIDKIHNTRGGIMTLRAEARDGTPRGVVTWMRVMLTQNAFASVRPGDEVEVEGSDMSCPREARTLYVYPSRVSVLVKAEGRVA